MGLMKNDKMGCHFSFSFLLFSFPREDLLVVLGEERGKDSQLYLLS